MAKIQLNNRDVANILAALRFWQEEVLEFGTGEIPARFREYHFQDQAPYTGEEIDALCEHINLTGTLEEELEKLGVQVDLRIRHLRAVQENRRTGGKS